MKTKFISYSLLLHLIVLALVFFPLLRSLVEVVIHPSIEVADRDEEEHPPDANVLVTNIPIQFSGQHVYEMPAPVKPTTLPKPIEEFKLATSSLISSHTPVPTETATNPPEPVEAPEPEDIDPFEPQIPSEPEPTPEPEAKISTSDINVPNGFDAPAIRVVDMRKTDFDRLLENGHGILVVQIPDHPLYYVRGTLSAPSSSFMPEKPQLAQYSSRTIPIRSGSQVAVKVLRDHFFDIALLPHTRVDFSPARKLDWRVHQSQVAAAKGQGLTLEMVGETTGYLRWRDGHPDYHVTHVTTKKGKMRTVLHTSETGRSL